MPLRMRDRAIRLERRERLFAPERDPAEALDRIEVRRIRKQSSGLFPRRKFDQVPLLAEHPVDPIPGDPRRVLPDMGRRAEALGNEQAEMIRVASRVRDDMTNAIQPLDQAARLRAVAPPPGRDRDPDRQAESIDGGVDLCGRSPLRASDTGSVKPPF